ncbi:transmembrane anchor protein [Falsirhodobacter sp. 1013]|uniref:transmembrane anchor protein n=1 Tax=Falsirhodobacter sp. 1013 TaxID=3417566 RepID=UPI003EB77FA3
MHNVKKPTLDELPTSAQLLRSTFIAAGAAAAILVTVVLPSEYAIDPTGIGEVLGLTEMGEIKTQLADEAEADRLLLESEDQSSLGSTIFGFFVGTAHAQTAPAWTDTIQLTLEPGVGSEVKLVMEEGGVAAYAWSVDKGAVNYDLHGDGGGEQISYEKGRGETSGEGELTAAFTGNHGWFFRNRGSDVATVTLNVGGAYTEVKRFD